MSDASSRAITPVLDHVVINVLGQLDEAAAQYEQLGFQLTERGHHIDRLVCQTLYRGLLRSFLGAK